MTSEDMAKTWGRNKNGFLSLSDLNPVKDILLVAQKFVLYLDASYP